MPAITTYNLSDEERMAVLEEMAILGITGSPEDYLKSIQAGQRELDRMVEQSESRRASKLSAAVPALIKAKIDPDLVVSLAEGYAKADEKVRAEIQSKLLG